MKIDIYRVALAILLLQRSSPVAAAPLGEPGFVIVVRDSTPLAYVPQLLPKRCVVGITSYYQMDNQTSPDIICNDYSSSIRNTLGAMPGTRIMGQKYSSGSVSACSFDSGIVLVPDALLYYIPNGNFRDQGCATLASGRLPPFATQLLPSEQDFLLRLSMALEALANLAESSQCAENDASQQMTMYPGFRLPMPPHQIPAFLQRAFSDPNRLEHNLFEKVYGQVKLVSGNADYELLPRQILTRELIASGRSKLNVGWNSIYFEVDENPGALPMLTVHGPNGRGFPVQDGLTQIRLPHGCAMEATANSIIVNATKGHIYYDPQSTACASISLSPTTCRCNENNVSDFSTREIRDMRPHNALEQGDHTPPCVYITDCRLEFEVTSSNNCIVTPLCPSRPSVRLLLGTPGRLANLYQCRLAEKNNISCTISTMDECQSALRSSTEWSIVTNDLPVCQSLPANP